MKNLIIISLSLIVLGGCSNQSLYDSIQANQEEECRRMPPGQQEQCFAQLETSYEEYERQREELLEE